MQVLTLPVQKVGQASFKAVPAPCGSQVDKYGVRTASGTAAGLKGVAVHDAPRTGASKEAPAARRVGKNMVASRVASKGSKRMTRGRGDRCSN